MSASSKCRECRPRIVPLRAIFLNNDNNNTTIRDCLTVQGSPAHCAVATLAVMKLTSNDPALIKGPCHQQPVEWLLGRCCITHLNCISAILQGCHHNRMSVSCLFRARVCVCVRLCCTVLCHCACLESSRVRSFARVSRADPALNEISSRPALTSVSSAPPMQSPYTVLVRQNKGVSRERERERGRAPTQQRNKALTICCQAIPIILQPSTTQRILINQL